MSFSYKTYCKNYVDITEAGDNDRIIVTLDDDRVVTLQLKTRIDSRGTLTVDRARTDQAILDELYDGIDHRLRRDPFISSFDRFANIRNKIYQWRTKEIRPNLETIRADSVLEVGVRPDGDAFDYSPRVGEPLCVMARMPQYGGSGHFLKPSIRSVEFTTV